MSLLNNNMLLSRPASLGSDFNNYSARFNGTSSYITLPSNSAFSFTNGSGTDTAFTICGWFKFTARSNFRVFSRANGSGQNTLIVGCNSNGELQIVLYGAGSTSINIVGRTSTPPDPQKWIHVVWTYSGSETTAGIKIYVNGVSQTLVTAVQGSYTGMTDYGSAIIGRHNVNGTITYTQGFMDELCIFKGVAFTQSEVDEAYNAGFVLDMSTHSRYASHISAYYRFENNANDSSPNALHGTPTSLQYFNEVPYRVGGNRDLLIMLSGQSNAAGQTVGSVYPYILDPFTAAEILTGSPTWSTWQALDPPTNNQPVTDGYGPEGGSSLDWQNTAPAGRKIYWGKFAVHSTPLWDDPSKNNFNVADNTYINDLKTIAASMNAKAASLTSPIKIFIWVHGESDANASRTAVQYKADFDAMFAAIETNITFDYVIIARLHNSSLYAGTPAIQTAMDNIVASNPRFVSFDLNNYPIAADNLHYGQGAYIWIGQDMLKMILKRFNLYYKK